MASCRSTYVLCFRSQICNKLISLSHTHERTNDRTAYDPSVCVCVAFPFTFGWMNGISNPINITHLLKLCQVFHKKISYGRMHNGCVCKYNLRTYLSICSLHCMYLCSRALVSDVLIESRASHRWIPKFWVCVCKVYDWRRYILNASNLYFVLLFYFPKMTNLTLETLYNFYIFQLSDTSLTHLNEIPFMIYVYLPSAYLHTISFHVSDTFI